MAYTKVTGSLVDIGDLDLTNVGQIQLDSIAGDADSNTSITFSGSDVITIATGGSGRLTIGDGALSPVTDNQIDLGTSSLEYKDLFLDGTAHIDTLDVDVNATVGGTLGVTGVISPTTHIDMPDSAIIKLCTGDDLQIYHDGGNARIYNTTGAIINRTTDFHIQDSGGSGTSFLVDIDGATTLYHNQSAKFVTASGGASITGQLDLSSHLDMPDSAIIKLGGGDDLQIYHDGSHSYISDTAVGNLIIQGSNLRLAESDNTLFAFFTSGAGGEFYYDGSKKFETTSAGVDVTGSSNIEKALSSDTQSTPETILTLSAKYTSTGADGAAGAGARLLFEIPDDNTNPRPGAAIDAVKQSADDGLSDTALVFSTSQNDSTLDEAMRIDKDGKVGLGEAAPHEKMHITGASGTALLMHMDADTADGTAAILFKLDSTNDDRRIKYGIFAQRGDPGTRGTGELHFCLNGVNSDTNVSVSDTKIAIGTNGVVSGDFNDTSDLGFKENVADLGNTLEIIKQLKPRTFTWKGSKELRGDSVGFIAQEVKSVISDETIVQGTEWEKDGDTGLMVNTIGIVAYLTKAVQELEARIKILEG